MAQKSSTTPITSGGGTTSPSPSMSTNTTHSSSLSGLTSSTNLSSSQSTNLTSEPPPPPPIPSPNTTHSQDTRDHDGTLTSTTTLVVTMTIPLGTTTSGTVEWLTTVQTGLTVQLVLPSDFNLASSNTHGSNNSATIGIVFGAISLALLFLAGMFVILRRHFKKKYSEDRLRQFEKFAQPANVGPYNTTAAQAGISHLRREDLESAEELSEETAVMSPIIEYRESRRSPVEVPRLYTDGSSVSTASSFITVSSVPVPFYERIKEARRAGIRKYTM